MAEKVKTEDKTEEIKAVVYADLKKTHGGKAIDVYNRIADLGGFGRQGKNHIGANGEPDFPTLDLAGVSGDLKLEILELLKNGDK